MDKQERKVTMMKCGHTANAVTYNEDGSKRPCCAICFGLDDGADKPVEEENLPDLFGRMAKCSYCSSTQKSNLRLPFFEHRPKEELDSYYCGCMGWD